jgi:hypothetical protein
VNRTVSAAAAVAALLWLCLGGTAFAAAPANDNFANATPLSGLHASATGTNVEATTESGEPEHTDPAWLGSVTPGKHSVWWSWTAPSDADVTVDTCGSSFDTLLAVYSGGGVEALTPVASNDTAFDGCETDQSGVSKLSFAAQSGHTYRIAVDGVIPYWCAWSPCSPTEGRVGDIALALNESPPPANDDFANATVLTEDETERVYARGTSVGAGKEAGEPSHAGDAGGNSVWWSWTAPRSGVVAFGTCGSPGVDTLLAVYTGDAVSALTEVVSAKADPSCQGSHVIFRASAGQSYHVAVDVAAGSIGGFHLQKQRLAPPNDEFENATPLSGHSATAYGNTTEGIGATRELGEPDHAGVAAGHSVWWSWRARASGVVQIDTCESYFFDSVLAVYTGNTVDDLTLVADNDDRAGCGPGSGVGSSAVEFTAAAGTTYRIAIDGSSNAAARGLYDTGYYFALTLRGPAVQPPPEPGRFAIDGVKRNKRKGTAVLTVQAPGPGEVALARTRRVRSKRVETPGAGKVPLHVRLRRLARQKLLSTGAIRVRANVTYTPTSGEPDTRSMKLSLKLRR